MYTLLTLHHVPNNMSCRKATVMITRRAHCFHDFIYTYIKHICMHYTLNIAYLQILERKVKRIII